MHCSWDPQPLYSKKNIKNRSHGTIHTFQLYGTTSAVHALLSIVHALFIHYSQDSQPLYSKKNIKNGSHGTIHIFKNYFVTVFSIFNF